MTNFADLSHHNDPVDLAAYARAGHNRIVLKATEGTGFTDPAFAARWQQAGQLGLARVAYHFARAKFDGADEFDHCWSVIQAAGGLTDRDRIALDVEDTDTPNSAAANARQFTARAVNRGITTGLVYTYLWYATHHAIVSWQFPTGWRQLWLADYTVGQPDDQIELGAGWTRDQVVARQFTDRATVAGVQGTCDYNRVLHEWVSTPIEEVDEMAGYSLADDERGQEWVKRALHDQVQLGVQAVLKGGSNSGFDGLPGDEQTALEQTEQRLTAKLDTLGQLQPKGA